MCPQCFSLNRKEVPLSGRGTVHGWTIPRHPQPFGFKESPIVAVIELEEGIRMVSNVVDCAYDQIKQDMPVIVAFEATMNNHKVPVFKPRCYLLQESARSEERRVGKECVSTFRARVSPND